MIILDFLFLFLFNIQALHKVLCNCHILQMGFEKIRIWGNLRNPTVFVGNPEKNQQCSMTFPLEYRGIRNSAGLQSIHLINHISMITKIRLKCECTMNKMQLLLPSHHVEDKFYPNHYDADTFHFVTS